jgi:hypothetical protein
MLVASYSIPALSINDLLLFKNPSCIFSCIAPFPCVDCEAGKTASSVSPSLQAQAATDTDCPLVTEEHNNPHPCAPASFFQSSIPRVRLSHIRYFLLIRHHLSLYRQSLSSIRTLLGFSSTVIIPDVTGSISATSAHQEMPDRNRAATQQTHQGTANFTSSR